MKQYPEIDIFPIEDEFWKFQGESWVVKHGVARKYAIKALTEQGAKESLTFHCEEAKKNMLPLPSNIEDVDKIQMSETEFRKNQSK